MARKKKQPKRLATLRASVARVQAGGGQLLARLGIDTRGLMARTRKEVARDTKRIRKEMRKLGRDAAGRAERAVRSLEARVFGRLRDVSAGQLRGLEKRHGRLEKLAARLERSVRR